MNAKEGTIPTPKITEDTSMRVIALGKWQFPIINFLKKKFGIESELIGFAVLPPKERREELKKLLDSKGVIEFLKEAGIEEGQRGFPALLAFITSVPRRNLIEGSAALVQGASGVSIGFETVDFRTSDYGVAWRTNISSYVLDALVAPLLLIHAKKHNQPWLAAYATFRLAEPILRVTSADFEAAALNLQEHLARNYPMFESAVREIPTEVIKFIFILALCGVAVCVFRHESIWEHVKKRKATKDELERLKKQGARWGFLGRSRIPWKLKSRKDIIELIKKIKEAQKKG